MRSLSYAAFAICIAGPAFGQSTDSPPRFDAADVHASRSVALPRLNGPFTSAGLYKVRFATMVDLIALAYNVDASRVLGGPTWLELDRFDVIAKPPAGSPPEIRRRMLQTLLAERFHLAAHTATRPMRASALQTAPHLQLKHSGGSSPGCGYFYSDPRPTPTTITLRCRNLSMPEFAEQIRNIARQGRFWSPLPVIDRTGLPGGWDFEFEYDPQLAPFNDNSYLSQNLEKQIGLKLEDIRIPAPIVEVESVDRTPAPNPPDLAQFIPPTPTEFDAAEIKPADPSPGAWRPTEIKNGRVLMSQVTVANLIAEAWDVTESEIVGLPKWAQSGRVDLVAKAPPEVSAEGSNIVAQVQSLDLEPLLPMLRSLLADRYKLKVHMEERPLPSFALLAVKPNLQKADPSARTTCHDGPFTDSASPKTNSALGLLVSCQNVTMAQFAAFLLQLSPGDLHGQVFDATGLAGSWQFSLNFFSFRQISAAANRSADPGQPADPTGRLSIFDAVSKQLGLKLEAQKHPRPALIVDRIEP